MTIEVCITNEDKARRSIRVACVDYATSQGGKSQEASARIIGHGDAATEHVWHGRSIVITEVPPVGKYEAV